MGEADADHAVRRLELAVGHDGSFVIAADGDIVDDAIDLVTLHLQRDLLRDGFAGSLCLVHGVVRLAAAVQLERGRAEAAHDEAAVAVGGAVQAGLLGRAHGVAGDHQAIGVRVVVAVHVHGLVEGGGHGVVARLLHRGVPVGDGRPGGHVKAVAFLGEERILFRLALLGGTGVHRAHPAGNLDAAVGNGCCLLLVLHACHAGHGRALLGVDERGGTEGGEGERTTNEAAHDDFLWCLGWTPRKRGLVSDAIDCMPF